jgi:hypothetical protein
MQMKKLIPCLALCLMPLFAQAQIVQAKGAGTLSYTGAVTPELKERAYVKAQLAAVERYFAESGEAESRNFETIEAKVQENLDKFLLSTAVLTELDQPGLHKYSMAVRVEINVTKLRNTLREASAVNKASTGAKSQLVYVFVGREVASARSFDVRSFKKADAEVESSASKRGVQRASVQVETGGSETRKADDVSYRLLPMANVITSITSVFSDGGFIVADPAFAIGDKDISAINKDFSAGNDLGAATLRSVVASLRKQQVPLIVLVTLDVGAPSRDPATGNARTTVNVSGRVLDLTNPLPREVVSVPAAQFFGSGRDNQDARDNGLVMASLATARGVVSRLNAQGVK